MAATLNEIYNARSIALIGASQDPNKAGYQVLKLLLDVGYEGKVYPVHPKEPEILGRKCYPSILDIPDAVDVMVVAVSAKVVINLMKQAEQRGDVKGAVVLSAGFAETGVPELVEAEAELVRIAKRAGIRVFGPNCIGMAYPALKLNTGFAPGIKLIEGSAAYVSQSGAFGGALLMFAGDQPCPQGFTKFGHIGNMCDVSNLELIEAFNNDPSVSVTGAYMEAVKDGRELMRIAAASEKPNLILKVGRSSLGRRRRHVAHRLPGRFGQGLRRGLQAVRHRAHGHGRGHDRRHEGRGQPPEAEGQPGLRADRGRRHGHRQHGQPSTRRTWCWPPSRGTPWPSWRKRCRPWP